MCCIACNRNKQPCSELMGERGPLRGQRHLDSYGGGEEVHEHRQSKGQKGDKKIRRATTAKAAKPIDMHMKVWFFRHA